MTISDGMRNLIIDYIDGNLSSADSAKVTRMLSENPELYNEYKVLRSISESAAKSVKAYAPSEEITSKIFSAIGITSTTETAAVGASEKNAVRSGAFLSNIYKIAMPVLASIAIFFSVYISGSNKDITNQGSGLSPVVASASAHRLNTKNSPLKKINSPSAAANTLNSNGSVTPPVASSTYDDETDVADNQDEIASDYDDDSVQIEDVADNETENPADSGDNAGGSGYISTISALQSFNYSAPAVSAYSRFTDQTNSGRNLSLEDYHGTNSLLSDIGLQVELKSSFYLNTKNDKTTDTRLKNIGVTVLGRVSRNFYVGVDVRDESFAIKSGNSPESVSGMLGAACAAPDEVTNANITSVGVALRYCAQKHFRDRLYPTAELILAKNSKGTVGRAGIALCYAPAPGLSATLGLEYSDLSYQDSDFRNLSVSKLGLNYGLSYNF